MVGARPRKIMCATCSVQNLSESKPGYRKITVVAMLKMDQRMKGQKSVNSLLSCVCVCVCARAHTRGACTLSHSVASDSLQPHGLQPARLLCPWNFPGKNTGVGCHFLLQEIFPIQESNLHLLHLLHWQAHPSGNQCHLETLIVIYLSRTDKRRPRLKQ